MILDLLVILFICYIGVIGFRRGLWLSALHLSSTLFALWLSSTLYNSVATRLDLFIPFPITHAYHMTYTFHYDEIETRFNHIIAFVIIFILTKVICYCVIVSFDYVLKQLTITQYSRYGGIALSFISSCIFSVIFLYCISLYPLDIFRSQLSNSLIARHFVNHIPLLSQFINEL